MFRTPMTLDRTQRVFTLLVCCAVAAAGCALVVSRLELAELAALPMAVALVALVFAWAIAPCALVIDSNELRVERRAWRPLCLPLSTIAGASVLETPLRGALRLFGVGGFFGSYGLFTSRALGRFRLYATRGGKAVFVRRSGGRLPIVVTPDDVDGAMVALARGG